jgi:hypothetical protein
MPDTQVVPYYLNPEEDGIVPPALSTWNVTWKVPPKPTPRYYGSLQCLPYNAGQLQSIRAHLLLGDKVLGRKGEGKGGGKLLLLLMERRIQRNVPFSRVQRQNFAGIPVMECDIGFAADYEISNWSTLHDELGYHQGDRHSKVNGYGRNIPYTQY